MVKVWADDKEEATLSTYDGYYKCNYARIDYIMHKKLLIKNKAMSLDYQFQIKKFFTALV